MTGWMKTAWIVLGMIVLGAAIASGAEPATVTLREHSTVIPTYPVGPAEKNPIFFSGRSYQGAKGPVYPYALVDRLTDQKQDRTYREVVLENCYVRYTVLPELGGRIFSGQDKTNAYDFVYRQHVIKPALIGMVGAWISGGIEWNIPHHHRASTFMPVQCRLVENRDGSKTVWLGETELRHRMRWLVGLTLRPDRSYLEVTIKLFNRTPLPHSMLYFANVAVHANPDYQVIFPPSTEFGTQHGKREFVHWPIGRETYGGMDRTGVDLSWWKNHPTPVSIFAWNYADDFFGGYDHGKQAGMAIVADHHSAPGKKFFEFSNSDEGRMWDKVLTDSDGPYLELMAGAYSDNQPDYSWVAPHEVKVVKQYWYPIRQLGGIKNANLEAAVNLEVGASGTARVAFNTTRARAARARLTAGSRVLLDEAIEIAPERPYVKEVALGGDVKPQQLVASLVADGKTLVRYQPARPKNSPTPAAVEPPPPPAQMKTSEELYLAGLRLEQFHSPALEPYPYYEEALKRDPGDSRANTALAILYLKRGMDATAEKHLRAAVERITRNYTRPKDTEALYYLGLALQAQGKLLEAENALHQAAWDSAWYGASHYILAELACRRGLFGKALQYAERATTVNALDTRALNLKTAVLRKLNRLPEALALSARVRTIDPLDPWSGNETALALQAQGEQAPAARAREELKTLLHGEAAAYLELAADYAACALWQEAADVLTPYVDAAKPEGTDALACYHLAYYLEQLKSPKAREFYQRARQAKPDYVFPFQRESAAILQHASQLDPADPRAPYYLGNLFYDAEPKRAMAAWEKARALDDSLATVHRNLGLGYAQTESDLAKAVASLEKAVACDARDPKLYADLDSVYEAAGAPPEKRLAVLEGNHPVVAQRDDALLREIELLVLLGRYPRALELLDAHHFHLWEGQSGVHDLWVNAHLLRGETLLRAGKAVEALKDFEVCLEYPDRFETGRPSHGGPQDARIHYLWGKALEMVGDSKAKDHYELATRATHSTPAARYARGLAFRELGQNAKALEAFDTLVRSGQERLAAKPKVDFFAKFGFQQSERVQKAEAHYQIGLGYLGRGHADAKAELAKAVELDVNHLGARTALASLAR